MNKTFRPHPKHSAVKALSERECADKDLDKLRTLWEFLGYRVRWEENQTAEEIKRIFNEIRTEGDPAKTIQEEDDSFVCCISSHGAWDPTLGTDVVYGVEGVWLEKEGQVVVEGALDIKALAYDKLSPLQEGCPKLKECPKLFFTQACRGKEHGRIAEDGTMGTEKQFTPKRLQRETDFLFAYPTAPGCKSYRDTSDGSFFITYLCQYLKIYASELPLVPILEAVSQKQALDDPFELSNVKTRQSPNFTSSLRGPVFFCNEARKRYKKKMLSGLKTE